MFLNLHKGFLVDALRHVNFLVLHAKHGLAPLLRKVASAVVGDVAKEMSDRAAAIPGVDAAGFDFQNLVPHVQLPADAYWGAVVGVWPPLRSVLEALVAPVTRGVVGRVRPNEFCRHLLDGIMYLGNRAAPAGTAGSLRLLGDYSQAPKAFLEKVWRHTFGVSSGKKAHRIATRLVEWSHISNALWVCTCLVNGVWMMRVSNPTP